LGSHILHALFLSLTYKTEKYFGNRKKQIYLGAKLQTAEATSNGLYAKLHN